jgi:hypothetical protein
VPVVRQLWVWQARLPAVAVLLVPSFAHADGWGCG